jgi:phenylalanyl-tRNA synthetase beta chain
VEKFLGQKLSAEECVAAVERMGCRAEAVTDTEKGEKEAKSGLRVYPAEYRNDFLHAADVVEDVMIGRTMRASAPVAARLYDRAAHAEHDLSRKAKECLIGWATRK